MRRRFQAAFPYRGTVQIGPRFGHLHQQLPGGTAIARVQLPHREVGTQRFVVLGKRQLQFRRNRTAVHSGIPLGREAPAQYASGKPLEVGQEGLRLPAGPETPLFDALPEQPLTFNVPAVQNRARLYERVGGHHQSGRLDEAEPLQVVPDLCGQPLRHRSYPVSGQR